MSFMIVASYISLLSIGGMMSLLVKSKTEDSVKCKVVDGGELKSRRHLNVRGKSATLPSITGQIQLSYFQLLKLIVIVQLQKEISTL